MFIRIGQCLMALFGLLAVSMGFVRALGHISGIYTHGQGYFAENSVQAASAFGSLMSGLALLSKVELISLAHHRSYTNGWYFLLGFLFIISLHTATLLYSSFCASRSIFLLATLFAVATPIVLVIISYLQYGNDEPTTFYHSFHWCCTNMAKANKERLEVVDF